MEDRSNMAAGGNVALKVAPLFSIDTRLDKYSFVCISDKVAVKPFSYISERILRIHVIRGKQTPFHIKVSVDRVLYYTVQTSVKNQFSIGVIISDQHPLLIT